MSPHKTGIPDRWLDYQAVGKRLPGSRFIAFKVPLKLALNNRLSSGEIFGHWELLDALKREKQELGLIIDLTFTTRYYKAEDVPESLHFVKIFTAGHEIPKDATILSFKRTVHRFLRDNAHNDKLIGVHCTHGLNRTGYLICRYLIDVDGVDPHKAIELFNSSRGHSIERQNYIQDLQSGPKRSNKGIEESEQEPVKGCSIHRPIYSETNESHTEERPSFSHESSRDRRRQNHPYNQPWHRGHSQFGRPSPDGAGIPPTPWAPALPPYHSGSGLLPSPAFPPTRPHFNPYRWVRRSEPPQTNYQWRGPPQHSREDRRNEYSAHAFSSSSLPAPSHWDNDSSRYATDADMMFNGPIMRPPYRRK